MAGRVGAGREAGPPGHPEFRRAVVGDQGRARAQRVLFATAPLPTLPGAMLGSAPVWERRRPALDKDPLRPGPKGRSTSP